MKLKIESLESLFKVHIANLEETRIRALAYLMDIEIDDFYHIGPSVGFCMSNNFSKAYLRCYKGYKIISFGRTSRDENRRSYGGQYSMADAISLFVYFYCKHYSVVIRESCEIYTGQERQDLFLEAIKHVDIGFKYP